jgi:transitional endoplasmic reticulum ATPase
VVSVSAADDYIAPIPQDFWPDKPWAAVVRLRRDDVTVVDASGTFRLLKTSDAEYEVGNTVECRDSVGVVRVLSEAPIRYLDLSAGAEDVDRFKFERDPEGPTFDDFGGFSEVKARAREIIERSLQDRAKLANIGARPIKGVLFTGEPGTGKTLLARIIANESDANFYTISGPQVFSKWFGESEETLRRIFDDAVSNAPSIIFFDEIDSVATQRAESSHEASQRVVAQLLTLMDGIAATANVVVIAATNRLPAIDAALRRPGRFDWEIEFGLPTYDDRLGILRASARGIATGGALPHEEIAASTGGWSGADLAAIWTEAALLAVEDKREVILTEDYWGGFRRVDCNRRLVEPNATLGGGQA